MRWANISYGRIGVGGVNTSVAVGVSTGGGEGGVSVIGGGLVAVQVGGGGGLVTVQTGEGGLAGVQVGVWGGIPVEVGEGNNLVAVGVGLGPVAGVDVDVGVGVRVGAGVDAVPVAANKVGVRVGVSEAPLVAVGVSETVMVALSVGVEANVVAGVVCPSVITVGARVPVMLACLVAEGLARAKGVLELKVLLVGEAAAIGKLGLDQRAIIPNAPHVNMINNAMRSQTLLESIVRSFLTIVFSIG